MNKQQKSIKNFRFLVYSSTLVVWLVTTILSLTSNISDSMDKYQTSEIMLRVIQVLISLPMLIIYASIAYAAVSFTKYSHKVRGSKESKGYSLLSTALTLTLAGYLLNALLNAYRTFLYGNSIEFTFVDGSRIYLSLLFGILVYWFFYKGGLSLVNTIDSKNRHMKTPLWLYASAGALSAAFTYVVFNNTARTFSTEVRPTYGVSDPIIFSTIVLPLLFSWTLGLFAVFYLTVYSKHVKGIIYKDVFRKVSHALIAIIALGIFLQIITQFSESITGAGLNIIVGLIAFILLVLVAAYYTLVQATKKLQKIEDV